MGGSLTMVIRHSDGRVWHRGVHTNSMSHYIHNPKFLAEDKECLDYYESRWPGEPDSDGKNWWGDYEHLAPHYYGMVFVDFVNKKIYSMQNYTTFGFLHGAGIDLSIPIDWVPVEGDEYRRRPDLKEWEEVKAGYQKGVDRTGDPFFKYEIELFVEYAMQNKIYYDDFYTVERKESFGDLPVPKDFETESEAYLWFIKNYTIECMIHDRKREEEEEHIDNHRRCVSFSLDLSPWEVVNFPESSEGAQKFLDVILESGIELSDDDRKEWHEFIENQKEHEEDYEDDEDDEDDEDESN